MNNYNYYSNSNTAIMIFAFISIICSILATFFMLIGNNDFTAGMIMISLFSSIFMICSKKRSNIALESIVAFILRFGICIFYTMKGDGDVDYYGVNATLYASMPLGQVITEIPTGAYLYSWIISFLFRIFGEYYMPVRVFNAGISVFCIWILHDIVNDIYGSKIAKRATWIAAIFPNLIRFSSLFANREVILLFFMLLYVKNSYRYYRSGNPMSLIKSIISVIPAMILHTSMIVMMLLTMLIIIMRKSYKEHAALRFLKKALLVTIIGVVFVYMLSNGIGTEKFGIGGTGLDIEKISTLGNMSAAGRAAYLANVKFSNPFLNILFLPVRMLYFLFTPFPWMISAVVDIVGLFDAVLYIWVSIPVIKKARRVFKDKNRTKDEAFTMFLTITLIFIIAMFAAVTSNYGTAIRHRCKLFLLFLIIAADDIYIPFKLRR